MVYDPREWLAGATIDAAVHALRLLATAEARATMTLTDTPLESQPHIAAWREAFRSFGAKPKRTRPSAEALLRRLPEGIPRIDRPTDAYNAVSLTHRIPIGGEDADRCCGPARLTRSSGAEEFATTKDGQDVIEPPEPGEVIWRDDLGVTCRRWNWRQCRRTRLTTSTTRAIFVLDALAPLTDTELDRAGESLVVALQAVSPGVGVATCALGRAC